MKKYLYLVMTVIIILVLVLILFFNKRGKFQIVELSYNNILEKINDDGAAILYTKNINSQVKDLFNKYYKDYKLLSYYSNLNLEEINTLLSEADLKADKEELFIIFMNGKIVDYVDVTDEERIVELLEKHLYNIIPESERYYRVLSTANEYIKKVNSNNYTVAVFGIDDCTYCDLYLPVVNNIAKDYNLDIYYFNRDQYDVDEYDKIMNLDFEIPSKCTTTGYSTTMSKSFPKPMTIITKGGKFVDCIRGYVPEDVVLTTLKEYKIIKE